MKKVKFDTKSDKSVKEFFDNENLNENSSLSFANNTNLLEIEEDKGFTDKYRSLINALKQIFLFLPGTFLLYFIGFVSAILLMDIFIVLNTPPSSEPVQILGITSAPIQIIMLGTLGVLGIFMTWFGLGDIKNKKHLSIPASIIFTGVIVAAVVKAITGLFGGEFIEDFDQYFILLLPLILIIPILTKSIIDRKTE